jgi:hypothetical protein
VNECKPLVEDHVGRVPPQLGDVAQCAAPAGRAVQVDYSYFKSRVESAYGFTA